EPAGQIVRASGMIEVWSAPGSLALRQLRTGSYARHQAVHLPGAMKSAYSLNALLGFQASNEAIHATHVSCVPCGRACNSQRSSCGPCAEPSRLQSVRPIVRHHWLQRTEAEPEDRHQE